MERIYALRKAAKDTGEPVIRDASFGLLIQTVREKRPKKILEIGVNVGLSGIAMLLNSPDSRLTGIEISEEKIEAARKNYETFGVKDRVRILSGDASEILPLITAKYDFIFLDGPKGHYFEYLPHILSALDKGGILFADNVLFRGYVGGKVKVPHRHATIKHGMENFLKALTSDKDLKTVVYDIEDGVSVTEKL